MMGTWGTAIFADDTAADVRDHFTDLVAEGLDAAAATKRLMREFKEIFNDEDETAVFWLALAATQSRLGRLTKETRDKAIRIIDSGEDLPSWRHCSSSQINQRKKNLAKLRQQLFGPQPEPKKLQRRKKSTTRFKPGDVAAYRLSDKISVRFCVLHVWGDLGGRYSEICLLGLEESTPFKKNVLKLKDTLGPHFTMLMQEPEDRITMLRRGVKVPKQDPRAFRAWLNLPVDGHNCFWRDFPDTLRRILRRLGWTRKRKSPNAQKMGSGRRG
jgi:hypothetical protein